MPWLTSPGSDGAGDPLGGQQQHSRSELPSVWPGGRRGGRVCSPASAGVGMVSGISDWVIGGVIN